MGQQNEPLDDAEYRAMEQLTLELYDHAALIRDVFNTIVGLTNHFSGQIFTSMPLPLRVAFSLLARLSTDLRSLNILAFKGYAPQAASLAASVYETAYTIAYIGSDEELAQKWANHDDPTRSFHSVKDMTRRALDNLAIQNSKETASKESLTYRQLCMAKHTNPLFQREHGFRLLDNEVMAMTGPSISEGAIRTAWFALESAAECAFVAIASFEQNHTTHLSLEAKADLHYRLNNIGAKCRELAARAGERWGTDDPFPGRWNVRVSVELDR